MALGVVGFEHGIKDSFEETDLVRCMSCSQLGDGIAGRVDESKYADSGDLMEATSYLQIKWRNCVVCSRDVGVEVRLSHVFGKDFSPFWYMSVRGYLIAIPGHILTVSREDRCEDGFGLFECERIPCNESL